MRLTSHCKLTGIITGTPSKVRTWQEQYPIPEKNVYSYATMDEVVDNPDIDIIYVVTPHHTHAHFAIAAARARKHVWLEKPMAMNTDECRSIIDACTEHGVTLALGYRMQHEPNTQTIMRYAAEEPFGPIRKVEARAGFAGFSSFDGHSWRLKKAAGGGALFDMGVYCINAARYATGEEPTRVENARQWTERSRLFRDVDEWTAFDLVFPSGAIAHCRTSFGQDMNLLRVDCEAGSYKLEPMQEDEVRGEASDGTKLDQTVVHQQAKQMDDDARAIIEGCPPLVPGEEGLRDIRIVEAVQRAARTGQPVELV